MTKTFSIPPPCQRFRQNASEALRKIIK